MSPYRISPTRPRVSVAAAAMCATLVVGCGGSGDSFAPTVSEAPVETEAPLETEVPVTEAPVETEAPVTEAPVATDVEAARWVSPTGDYSVIFPDGEEPVATQQTVPVLDTTFDIEFFLVERPTFAVSAAQFDYSELDGDYVVDLQGAVDGAVANIPGGALVSTTERTIDGRDAIEYEFTIDGGTGRAMVVENDGDVIQLQALGLTDGDHTSFIDTFEFTGEAE